MKTSEFWAVDVCNKLDQNNVEKINDGYGSGYGFADGHGYGEGCGYGHGSGSGAGYGDGSGSGFDDGTGSGSGGGSGYGDDSGRGDDSVYFNGLIAHPKIFKRAFSPSEIKTLYMFLDDVAFGK